MFIWYKGKIVLILIVEIIITLLYSLYVAYFFNFGLLRALTSAFFLLLNEGHNKTGGNFFALPY